jgi:integrase
MRIGEALALDVGDLDFRDRLLTVRRGKFGKTRILPLRPSTIAALDRYLRHPKRPMGIAASSPIFVSCRRRRLSHPAAAACLSEAFLAAGIIAPRPPSPHDLRHAFAVHRVAAWYAEGRDVNTLLPALSTYLGHVSVENTRIYLRENGLILEQAAARFEAHTTTLDGKAP